MMAVASIRETEEATVGGIDSNFLFRLSREEEERRRLLMQALSKVNAQRQEAVAPTDEEEALDASGSGLLDLSRYADSLTTGDATDPVERARQAIARAQGVSEGTASTDTLFQDLAATLAGFDPNQIG